MALASGPDAYAARHELPADRRSPNYCWWASRFRFVYHFCNGIRHLVWDTGRGLERAQARRSGCGGDRRRAAAHRARRLARLPRVRPRRWAGAMSLRSPLGKVLGRGSAGEGVGHWWVQRVTAVALLPLTLWFVMFAARPVAAVLRRDARVVRPALGGGAHHPAGDHAGLAFQARRAGGHRRLRPRQGRQDHPAAAVHVRARRRGGRRHLRDPALLALS